MKIGYQLFSAISLCQGAKGLKDTIRSIAAMGYDGVEFCSYEGIPANEMKDFLAEQGITAINSHVQMERFLADMEGEVRYAAEAGIPYITLPWVAPDLRNEEGYQKIDEMISKIIDCCKKYNIKLLYHNHEFEFEKSGDTYILDTILDTQETLGLELDTFWAYYKGINPAAYMKEKRENLVMIHIKDYESFTGGGIAGNQEMPTFSAIGTGNMDNDSVIREAVELGLIWVVVEQDNSKIDVLESAAISIKSLKKYQ